jgi:hypothetical protein
MHDPNETERYVTKFAWLPIYDAWGRSAWLKTVVIRRVRMRWGAGYQWLNAELFSPEQHAALMKGEAENARAIAAIRQRWADDQRLVDRAYPPPA